MQCRGTLGSSRAIRPAKSGTCSVPGFITVSLIVSLYRCFYLVASNRGTMALAVRNDLPRVQNIVRVEGTLQAGHQVKGVLPMLGMHELHFMQANTVLARTSTFHTKSPFDQATIQRFGLLPFCGIVLIEQHQYVEIAVAHMPHDGIGKAGTVQLGCGFRDTLGQT